MRTSRSLDYLQSHSLIEALEHFVLSPRGRPRSQWTQLEGEGAAADADSCSRGTAPSFYSLFL